MSQEVEEFYVAIKNGSDFTFMGKTMTNEEIADRLNRYFDTLSFYADGFTYFAISFISDPPCGPLMDDFSETDPFEQERPGKRARETIDKENFTDEQKVWLENRYDDPFP